MLRLPILMMLLAQSLLAAGDCEQKIPAPLKRLLSVKFPGYVVASFTDEAKSCITVAVGDFDGDGAKDIALLLMNAKTDEVRLVVALHRGATWTLHRLPTWCGTAETCYVQTVKPGLFERSEALDTPLSVPDERDRIRSRTESVLSGTVEATGFVHVYSAGKWHYVQVSD